jgi:hypothetical protein
MNSREADESSLGLHTAALGGTRDIVAKDSIDPAAVIGEGQSQPKQHDMVSALGRAPHDAIERGAHPRHACVDAAPIAGLLAGKHVVHTLTRNLLPVNVVEPRSRQPESGIVHAASEFDQADIGKKLRDLERIDVGSRGHRAPACRPKPIIE